MFSRLPGRRSTSTSTSSSIATVDSSDYSTSQHEPSEVCQEILQRILSNNNIGWYVAMDCEMVGTGDKGTQSALARISLVGWDGNVLLDVHVKVPVPVTDYRTPISGIEEADLKNGLDLKDARWLVQHITQGKILIGHGIDNDLAALMISHPPQDIRDTAKYIPYMKVNKSNSSSDSDNATSSSASSSSSFDFSRLRLQKQPKLSPRKLKELVQERLHLDIQQGDHSSVEDARAALLLYRQARPEWEALVSRQVREEGRRRQKGNRDSTSSSSSSSGNNRQRKQGNGNFQKALSVSVPGRRAQVLPLMEH